MKQSQKLSIRTVSPLEEDAEIGSDDDTAVIEDETVFDLPTKPPAGSERPGSIDQFVVGGQFCDAKDVVNHREFTGICLQGVVGFGRSTFGGTSPFEDELLRGIISGRLRL